MLLPELGDFVTRNALRLVGASESIVSLRALFCGVGDDAVAALGAGPLADALGADRALGGGMLYRREDVGVLLAVTLLAPFMAGCCSVFPVSCVCVSLRVWLYGCGCTRMCVCCCANGSSLRVEVALVACRANTQLRCSET